MKESVRIVNEKQKNMRLNSVNSRKITSLQVVTGCKFECKL